MNARFAVFLILLAIAGGAIVILLNGGGEPAPLAPAEQLPAIDPDTEFVPDAPLTATAAPDPIEPPTSLNRERIDEDQNGAQAEAAQGVMGRVVDPGGNPVPGTRVYLVKGTGSDMFEHLQLAGRGAVVPPVTSTVTDTAGQFRLGLGRHEPEVTYEIRIVTDRFMDHNIPNVRIADAEWFDAGTIRLERGNVLQGRVTIKDSGGAPVAAAQVMVKPLSTFLSLTPIPGREDGLVVAADPAGNYRFENAPAGAVTVAAIAPGYARVEQPNFVVRPMTVNSLDLELPPGVSIVGTVTDPRGNPVAGAVVDAVGISTTTPTKNTARSDSQGRFEVAGLLQGKYRLSTTASGYVPAEVKPVSTNGAELRVVLRKQGSARLRVFDKNGGALRTPFMVSVKRYFPAQKMPGTAVGQPRRARPDRTGEYEFNGLDPQTYVFQIQADGHALAFSESFEIIPDGEPPLVEVRLDEGGVIAGTVVDQGGRPLAGVSVKTLSNDYVDNALFRGPFRAMIPVSITQTQTLTDARGQYELTQLNPGIYQLLLTHPEYYDVSRKDNIVELGKTTAVAEVKMQRGALISGVAKVDGTPSAQLKVVVTAVPDPMSQSPSNFNAEAATDNEGRFVVDKRVPPGRYQVTAARQTAQNLLTQITDFQRTRQEVLVAPGQEQLHVEINIPSR